MAVDGDEDKAGAEGRPAIGPRGLAGLLSWVKGRRDVLRNILFSTLSDTDICYHKSRGMQLLRVPIVDVLTALAGEGVSMLLLKILCILAIEPTLLCMSCTNLLRCLPLPWIPR